MGGGVIDQLSVHELGHHLVWDELVVASYTIPGWWRSYGCSGSTCLWCVHKRHRESWGKGYKYVTPTSNGLSMYRRFLRGYTQVSETPIKR